jgi:PAS domain S-box-containing protein
VLGYPREKIIGTNYQAFVTEEYVDAVYKVFNQVYQTGTPIRQFIWEVLREDGGRRFIEALLSPLQDQEGRLIGFRGVGRDITERKRADDELRQSEERYRTLFNSKLDGMCVMDETMKVLLVNQAAVDIFGFDSIDKALGANPFDFIPPEERERVLAIVKKDMFEDDLRQANEFRLTNKSGKDIWVSAIGTLTEYQGKLAGLISFRDITEHKRAEGALADEVTRRRILIEQFRDGIVVLDEKGKVYEANQRFAEMLGYSPEEVSELHMWDWDTQWTREQLLEMVRSVDAAGDHFETCHRRKDGTVFDVEISTNGAMFAGQKLVFCVCRDITARKQAEEALRRSE